MKNEIIDSFNCLRNIDPLISELFKYSFVNRHYLNNLTNYTNTKNINVLTQMGIIKCLKCDKFWSECTPNNSHNMSKEIMLGDFIYERNKIIIFNSTRPFTLKHLKIKKIIDLNKNINALLEDINNITTFGGICKNCDKIYNDEFECNKNLNFNKSLHMKLLIERASYFKYYRENLITEIINNLLNLKKDRDITLIEWQNYKKLCEKIKEKKCTENRKKFFSKENIILDSKKNIYYIKKTLSPAKGIMFSDVLYDNGKIFIINIFRFNNHEICVLASKEKISLNEFNEIFNKQIKSIDIKKGAENTDFKDVVIHPNYLFETADFNMKDFLYFKLDNIYLYLIFEKETYFIEIDEISKVFGINKYLFTAESMLKIKPNRLKNNDINKTNDGVVRYYINQFIYREIPVNLILISCSWYKYEHEGKKLKERKFKRVNSLGKHKGVLCVYNVLIKQ